MAFRTVSIGLTRIELLAFLALRVQPTRASEAIDDTKSLPLPRVWEHSRVVDGGDVHNRFVDIPIHSNKASMLVAEQRNPEVIQLSIYPSNAKPLLRPLWWQLSRRLRLAAEHSRAVHAQEFSEGFVVKGKRCFISFSTSSNNLEPHTIIIRQTTWVARRCCHSGEGVDFIAIPHAKEATLVGAVSLALQCNHPPWPQEVPQPVLAKATILHKTASAIAHARHAVVVRLSLLSSLA
mmetsp:Transcript_51635/g.120485  ORF Transcript_51635/g.120485 Transcript_51635/m.120485 type:complete len:236 (-) Transcript_51635:2787-3494(-)